VKLSLFYSQQAKKSQVVLEKKKDATDYSSFMPDPELLNKFMLYGMPIMIAVVTFTFFAGLGLYWGVGTIFMILQQLFVNKILKK
jgi:membrane protein insertase Oxa1/YidC/SpoIIIJ